jgi:hypothetical protein
MFYCLLRKKKSHDFAYKKWTGLIYIFQSAIFPTGDVSGVVEEPVIIDRVEHLRIMTIGINRPKKRNCVNEVNTTRVVTKNDEFV